MKRQIPHTVIAEVDGRPVPQQQVFDPAVKQYDDAFRMGSESITDPDERARWLTAKRAVGTALLDGIARSAFADTLVLRGSWLLALWFGDQAREPHDLDFVARRPARAGDTMGFLSGLLGEPELAATGVQADAVTATDIWTYERAEGRRLGVPWARPDGAVGVLQVDVTFDEDLDEPPAVTRLGTDTALATASIGQSLIWKLQWLLTDWYPQGKDLYDAVLLHRNEPLTPARWRRVVELIGEDSWGRPLPPARGLDIPDTEWAWFRQEYPQLASDGTLAALQGELLAAIAAVAEEE